MIDLIPAPTDGTHPPTAVLHLQPPEMLQISVTAGPTKRPVANHSVLVQQTHNYQWIADGEQRLGGSDRVSNVYTDDLGKATAVVESGKEVEVSIYYPDWHTTEKLHIVAGEHNTLALHRENDKPRPIFGIVLQDDKDPIPTDEITIVAGSVDGETRQTEQLVLRDNGVFLLYSQAEAVGVLATTKDQSMAGVVVAENPRRILRLTLLPTKPLSGRLVDAEGKPIAERTVHAEVRVTHQPKNPELGVFYTFVAFRRAVETDADGYYTFDAMPSGVEVAMSAESENNQQDQWLGIVELKAGDETAVETHAVDE